MDVSSQDPSLMAMDLSKSYPVAPLTRGHTEAMDLAKKPEWYHRRPASCSTEICSPFRTRASSSYNSLSARLRPEPATPVHCRDMEQRPESLGNYMNPTLARGLDLYHDGVHSNLWHPGFYGPDRTGSPAPESSGGEESDSGSDVIFLVSSAKEPLLCSPFIQDAVGHIVEPLSPAVSSLDEGRGCYHLPQPLSSPSPDSSYSDSSDSSVDIPVHHARPVVLLSDLSTVFGNHGNSPVDISSDDSDVIEVSVTHEKKKNLARETPPQSDDEKAPPRRSSRIRKSVSEVSAFTCGASRDRLKRRAKNDAVGIYNESCDSDDVIEYAARMSSSEADEPISTPKVSRRGSSNSQESGVHVVTDRKSATTELHLSHAKSVSHKRKKPLAVPKAKQCRRTGREQKCRLSLPQRHRSKSTNAKTVARRKKKRRSQTRPPAQFPPREPEIRLRYTMKEERKEKKRGSFCPFVHMERRSCTVVNYREEEATVRSSRGGQPQAASRSLSGFVPSTSCFQLARFSPESRCPATLMCCLCGQTANAMGMGDLHGPYHPAGPSQDSQNHNCRTEPKDEGPAPITGRLVNSSHNGCDGYNGYDDTAAKSSIESRSLPPGLHECWIHEDCGIWSAGVFLVRGRLYGLEEAARLAQETVSELF